MKPFLGIDLTTDKKNQQCNGAEFIVAQPSAAMRQAFNRSSKRAEETLEKSKLPRTLRIGQRICGAVGVLIFVGILRGLGDADGVSFGQAYKNAAWLFWLGGGCLLVWGLLTLLSHQKACRWAESHRVNPYVIPPFGKPL